MASSYRDEGGLLRGVLRAFGGEPAIFANGDAAVNWLLSTDCGCSGIVAGETSPAFLVRVASYRGTHNRVAPLLRPYLFQSLVVPEGTLARDLCVFGTAWGDFHPDVYEEMPDSVLVQIGSSGRYDCARIAQCVVDLRRGVYCAVSRTSRRGAAVVVARRGAEGSVRLEWTVLTHTGDVVHSVQYDELQHEQCCHGLGDLGNAATAVRGLDQRLSLIVPCTPAWLGSPRLLLQVGLPRQSPGLKNVPIREICNPFSKQNGRLGGEGPLCLQWSGPEVQEFRAELDDVQSDATKKFELAAASEEMETSSPPSRRHVWCDMCKTCFTKPANLRRHIREVHEQKREYRCNECGQAFSQFGNLRRHERTVHWKVKAHSCAVCSVAFSTSANYKRHLQSQRHRGRLLYEDVRRGGLA
eukprot:Plantae.Rhodophyta-Rhodochaete_pulchella.ctg22717.p1 GENE.Plantae.Rhodophyta-Rhodochaete_pulchella.ctg22717~~Plantae.Rhodophyta-Rhodochaete_pulchella.ctg22717.p1  ORF type:complete len:412 (-),score=33.33 Plantae.Rhodophyta-Rhodochaete_pulchella.ctg22717:602-1837(-)